MQSLHSIEGIPVDRQADMSCEGKWLHSELAQVYSEDLTLWHD